MKQFGIAFGGGGMRGFAHLGVVKALEERGLHFDAFSGTSAGSIVAALMAAEKKPEDIMEMMKDLSISDAARLSLPHQGLANLDNLQEKVDRLLDHADFEDLPHPLFLAAANLNTGRVEYLNSGNVAKAVQASSSIPILFSPVRIHNQLFVDGGLLDNVPVSPLTAICQRIVAVDIQPVEELSEINGLADIAMRTFQMSISMQDSEKEAADLLIRVEGLSQYHILDSGHNEEIFEIGYQHGRQIEIPFSSEDVRKKVK